MRLICPNCDAQYEVDAALIPAAGRDVQCSNCGTTWFQEPREAIRLTSEARVEPEPELVGAPEGASGHGLTKEAAAFFGGTAPAADPDDDYEDEEAETTFAPVARPAPEPVPEAVDLYDEAEIGASGEDEVQAEEPADDVAPVEHEVERHPPTADFANDEDNEEQGSEAPAPSPERPQIDAAVLGILRAEAEREIAARRAEAEDPPRAENEAESARDAVEARTARLRGYDAEEDAAVGGSARKTLLPDIDEINSTLTATSDRVSPRISEEVPSEVTQKRRSGFRMGFSLVLLAVAALILLYLFAPQIGATMPGLEPTLAGYVDWANGVRQNVDQYLERSVNSLTHLLVRLSS